MSEFQIQSPFRPSGDQPKAIDELLLGIKSKEKHQVLLGATGSGKTFTIANVINNLNKPTLILSHNKTLAAQLYGEFKSLFPNNAVEFFISYYDYYQPEAYLPVTDTFIEKDMSMDEELDRLRLQTTTSLMSRKDVIVIASVSCIFGIGSPESYKQMLVNVKRGVSLDIKRLFYSLNTIHYIRNDLVLEPGTYRLRGDTIEIFPAYGENALRIELFGDLVESIYSIKPLTGVVINEYDIFWIYPAKHFVTSQEKLKVALQHIRSELTDKLREFRSNGLLLEAQRLEQRTLYDIEMMTEIGYCSGVENYSRHLEGRALGEPPSTLLDYFPKDFLLIVDESHVSIPQINGMYKGDRSRKETLIEHGFRLPSALDNRPLKFKEFENKLDQTIYVSATPADYELNKTNGRIVEQIIRPTGILDPKIVIKNSKGQIDDLINEIRKTIESGDRVLVTTLTKRMSEDLTDYLKGINIKAEYMHSEIKTIERIRILRGLRMKQFDVLVGINLLREGLDLPEVSLVAILDSDKEGFLRSKTTLMQLAGRAARNINGKVILYGTKVTSAMIYLKEETDRRIKIQKLYNQKNNITPKTIYKSNYEIKNSTVVADEYTNEKNTISKDIKDMSLDELEATEQLKLLKVKMKKSARELQFEDAAILRDKIMKIESQMSYEKK